MKMNIFILIFVLILSSFNFSQEGGFTIGDNEILTQPTAFTMPAGNSYFTDYELVLLNYTYAVTNRTHIGALVIFPVTSEFLRSFTVGVKQNYWQTEYFNCAVYGLYMFWEKFYLFGNVFSIGKPSNLLNVSIVYSGAADEGAANLFFGLGYRYDFVDNFGLLFEYNLGRTINVFENSDNQTTILIGFRFHSESTSWEIGGMKALGKDWNSEIFMFPFLKGSYYFH